MGNFQKYWSQNVCQDFIVLDFFVGRRSCGRLMSPAHETQSMWEIRLLRGRLPWKGGGLTGMLCTWTMKSLKVTGQIVSVVWHYCQRFSLHCWGKVFQWLPKDWHKKVSDFCKLKFVPVHVAADWMNKFPNRGRYQIANITSWQNSLSCSRLSTLSVLFNNFNNEIIKRANQYTFTTRFHVVHKYSLKIRKETCFFVSLWFTC
jgi:hypothetical protein